MFYSHPPAPEPPINRFLTSVHPSGKYFLDQFGAPFLLCADQAGDVGFNIVPSDMTTYYSTRSGEGFNGNAMLLVSDAYYSGNNAQTFDGINAFTGTVGGFPDFSTPNPSYWSRIDSAVQLALQYGISIQMIPVVINDFSGDTYGWSMATANGATACNTFGQWLGNRYKSYPNTVFWRHSDDYQADNDTLVGAIRDGVASAYPGSIHSVEYSSGGGVPAYSYEANAYWQGHTQVNFVYPSTSNLSLWSIMQTAVAATSAQPAFLGESIFQGSTGWTDLILRSQVYWSMCAGLYGGCEYGDLQNTAFTTAGWQSRLIETTSNEFMFWAALMRSINWWTLVPDTSNVFLTSGLSSGQNLAMAALAADGSLGLVYAINSNPVVNMAKMRARTTARWYDPTLGTFTPLGTFANSGSQTFTLPSAHASDGTTDYALVLTA